MTETKPKVRHLLGLSGGKDSSALAIYMRDKVPEMEYFFSDTGAELPETLQFIDLLEDYLGKPIVRLNATKDFQHYFKLNGNFLPTARSRWCTIKLKIEPFENYIGTDTAITYVGIRADEPHRKGYISAKPNISAKYPFIEDGIRKDDVMALLESSGLGLPKYYDWRSRSGCFFCFFQRKEEWVGLAERHPDLFEQAQWYEDYHSNLGRSHTWSEGESLQSMVKRKEQILAEAALKRENQRKGQPKKLLSLLGDDDDEQGCTICHV